MTATGAPALTQLSVTRAPGGRGWVAYRAADFATVEVHTLVSWAQLGACVLVCQACPIERAERCGGHQPVTPLVGDHLVIGQRTNAHPDVVYRVHDRIPSTASVVLVRIA